MTLWNLVPVFCYIFSVLFLGEYISINRVLALILAFSGAVSVTAYDMIHSPGNSVTGG